MKAIVNEIFCFRTEGRRISSTFYRFVTITGQGFLAVLVGAFEKTRGFMTSSRTFKYNLHNLFQKRRMIC